MDLFVNDKLVYGHIFDHDDSKKKTVYKKCLQKSLSTPTTLENPIPVNGGKLHISTLV